MNYLVNFLVNFFVNIFANFFANWIRKSLALSDTIAHFYILFLFTWFIRKIQGVGTEAVGHVAIKILHNGSSW